MKIVPYIHKNAPELCYFTLNGVQSPKNLSNLDWYHALYRSALHPIAFVREKLFSPAKFRKVASIEVRYAKEDLKWLNRHYSGRFSKYSEVVSFVNGLKSRLVEGEVVEVVVRTRTLG